MTEVEFQDLCRDVSLELGREDINALGQDGRLELDDVHIALFFNEVADPDILFCYVDLGEIAEHQRVDVYENLLNLNLLTGTKTNGVFGVDPASGNAVMVSHLPVDELPQASRLTEVLRRFAQQAHNMRKTLLAGPIELPSDAQAPALNIA